MPRHCPECDEVLTLPGGECICGWGVDKNANRQKKPTIGDVKKTLTQILYRWKHDGHRWPVNMPNDFTEATDWALKLFEGHKAHEAPRCHNTANGKCWSWPYAERVEKLLHLFLASEVDFQNLIVAARHDRIAWRGESRDTFFSVINETEEMNRVGVDEYRRRCLEMLGKAKSSKKISGEKAA